MWQHRDHLGRLMGAGLLLVNLTVATVTLAGAAGPLMKPGATPVVPLPKFRLVTVTGEVYTQETLRGQPALLMFWAPWCPVCQRELPLLGDFYRTRKPPQLRVLAIGFADSRQNVDAYINAHPGTFSFPTAYDEKNRVATTFVVNATPMFVAVDAQGRIVLAHRGGGINQNPRYQAFLSSLTKSR
ncbi:MAG: TlpA family protein disulfide reductase [Nitrospiraceae bacterium]